MIKEVIFDIDDTIYDYETGHRAGMKQMASYAWEEFQVPEEKFYEEYKRIQKKLIARLGRDNASIHSRSIRLQMLLEEWGKPLFPHIKAMYRIYWDTLMKEGKPEPGILACMQKLKAMGITIGIGTDMTAMMQYEKLEVYGLAPYIDHMVTSQEAGVEKPHKDFMALCIQKSGVKPEECLFVGDTFGKDVAGAVKNGMHAVWYNRKQQARPENTDIPEGAYKEIQHYDELIPIMSTWKED